MTAVRKIIHIDLDAFFCAVEELRDPSLHGKPFAVGGRPESRGVVASCSYPARKFGIHSAMPMVQALRRCPDLIVVPARHGEYGTVSRAVMARLYELTPLVEQLSIDEAFLEVTDRPEAAAVLAHELQRRIRDELQLPCSLGVAANKLTAKIANNVGKAAAPGDGPPNAVMVVPPGDEAAFLAPLPCEALWGVGPRTAEKLAALGVHTIGDIANCPPADLVQQFGKHGAELARHARGIDDRPIVTARERKSISQEITFERDVADRTVLQDTVRRQATDVARVLRRKRTTGATVKIKLRWPDFTTITRQVTLTQPTDDPDAIFDAAWQLFTHEWKGQPMRLIGVGVSSLGADYRQLSLWDQPDEREERLQETVRELQKRFGAGAIRRASDIDPGGTESTGP